MKRLTVTLLDPGPLSKKEAEVLRQLCHGYSRGEIAAHLFRSRRTIDCHVDAIAAKFGCHSSAEIIATAVAAQLVTIAIADHGPLFKLVCCLLITTALMGAEQRLRIQRTTRVPTRVMRQIGA